MPRKNTNSCSMYLFLSDNRSYSKYAESPVFGLGCADGNDVSASIFCRQQKDFRRHKCLCQTSCKHIPAGYPKSLRSDQIGCWSVGTCAKADMTDLKGGDGFLRGVHACDGFLHLLFFLQECYGDGFVHPVFLVTDFFVARRKCIRRPSGRFWFTKPQWDKSLGQTCC